MNDVDWSGLVDTDTLLRRDHDLNLFGCLKPQIIYNKIPPPEQCVTL